MTLSHSSVISKQSEVERLWCVYAQKVEALEREEQNSGKAIRLVKGKVGKPKVKKMNLEETMPSQFARRVEPPTQPIKSDSAKKLIRKKKVSAGFVLRRKSKLRGLATCAGNVSLRLTRICW